MGKNAMNENLHNSSLVTKPDLDLMMMVVVVVMVFGWSDNNITEWYVDCR